MSHLYRAFWLLSGMMLGLALAGITRPGPVAYARPAPTETPLPTATPTRPTPTPTVTPTQTHTPQPSPTPPLPGARVVDPIEVTKNITLGWTGKVECWNCTPFSVRVKLSNYIPWAGGPNCWLWSDDFKYCMSETRSGLAWESFYGLAAACPEEWPRGAWVSVPEAGTFICLDTGNEIKCREDETGKYCNVDVLGPSGADWNQKFFDAVLWVSFNPRE